MEYKVQIKSKKVLGDILTPVNVYLKLRDVFAGSLLLESSDYHSHENSLSIVCCDPIAGIHVDQRRIRVRYPDKRQEEKDLGSSRGEAVFHALQEFMGSFSFPALPRKLPIGLFGFVAYDAVQFFESVDLKPADPDVPLLLFNVYRYLVIIDHFTSELTMVECCVENCEPDRICGGLDGLEQVIYSSRFSTFSFRAEEDAAGNMTDADYMEMVRRGIRHCHRGDVFQIVLSRSFSRKFRGDEFNVYRALRSINPSPYLFYFDFGNFKLFGSSPEAQLQVKDGTAAIFPIAGTYRRSGNDADDARAAKALAEDEKENAEHLMLVDLARNDLSRSTSDVRVDVFREIQYYSHVIHLVSKVTGKVRADESHLRLMVDTFPAGTLSGAPKHRALQLIDSIEHSPRGFYGGALGFLGFNGEVNMAIMIRTFLSRNNTLISQAGAGVVARSTPENELLEVNHKLEALRRAITMAETLGN